MVTLSPEMLELEEEETTLLEVAWLVEELEEDELLETYEVLAAALLLLVRVVSFSAPAPL